MNRLYRFSPIKTKKELLDSVNYVIDQSQKLCESIVNKNLHFSGYLTIFSHYFDEFESIKQMLLTLGEFDSEHNGLYVLLKSPIKTNYGDITRIRVRQPDPYRFQVGCGDFIVDNYDSFKKEKINVNNVYLREISRPDITMIEFWNPDFDTLAYIVK